jgi:hypothetical protein
MARLRARAQRLPGARVGAAAQPAQREADGSLAAPRQVLARLGFDAASHHAHAASRPSAHVLRGLA